MCSCKMHIVQACIFNLRQRYGLRDFDLNFVLVFLQSFILKRCIYIAMCTSSLLFITLSVCHWKHLHFTTPLLQMASNPPPTVNITVINICVPGFMRNSNENSLNN